MRRDFTNQHGYFCPTENEAIRNAGKDKRTSMVGSMLNKKTVVIKQKGPAKTPPKYSDESLKRARQLFSSLCCISGMMDFTIEEITLKAKGEPKRYRAIGDTRTIERNK